MIEAIVRGEEEGSGYGVFRFAALPSPGDRICLGNNRGSIDIVTVLYVEHAPVRVPPGSFEREAPTVRICVAFHHSFGDEV